VGVLGLTAPVAGTQAEACTTGGWRNLRLSRIFFWQSLLGPPSLIIALIIEYLTSAIPEHTTQTPNHPSPRKSLACAVILTKSVSPVLLGIP